MILNRSSVDFIIHGPTISSTNITKPMVYHNSNRCSNFVFLIYLSILGENQRPSYLKHCYLQAKIRCSLLRQKKTSFAILGEGDTFIIVQCFTEGTARVDLIPHMVGLTNSI